MSGSHRRHGEIDEQVGIDGRHRAVGRPPDRDAGQARAVTGGSDPRLAHAGAAAPGLLALQRSAGNAAVASLVGAVAPVQRAVTIDELTTDVARAPEPESGTGDGGAVTSDGATTTITGGTIELAAPMTHAAGVLRADTIIADNVVASSYTPGAGNVW